MEEKPIMGVQQIGHLRIIAAISKKYKIVETIDKLLPKIGNNQNFGHGQVVQAMIYQGLGLSYDRIYLAEKFFSNLGDGKDSLQKSLSLTHGIVRESLNHIYSIDLLRKITTIFQF